MKLRSRSAQRNGIQPKKMDLDMLNFSPYYESSAETSGKNHRVYTVQKKLSSVAESFAESCGKKSQRVAVP